MSEQIAVIKRDHKGAFVWEYLGIIIARDESFVCIEARFNRDKADIGVIVFERDDLMTEWFYNDRWYNVFKVQSTDGKHLKGYYCNITRPAEITADTVAADDLALDVFVSPKGEVTLLDEDEFASLNITEEERHNALDAVQEIRELVRVQAVPFDDLRG